MFNSYISLGGACDVASSMSEYGLRSFSTPFDWLIVDFEKVIYLIENNFEDFMLERNIELMPGNPLKFRDIKHELIFFHEIKNNLKDEFITIYQKYLRRIERFMQETKKKVCFIRTIRNQKDLDFIIQNVNRIKDIFKKSNRFNEIIFLYHKNILIPKQFPFMSYRLNIEKYSGDSRIILRSLFDTNEELIKFLVNNIPECIRKDNLIFDLRNESSYFENRYKLIHDKYKLINMVLNADFSKIKLPEEIVIYGAGNIGMLFYDRVKEYCKIISFCDRSGGPKNSYKGIDIVKPKDLGTLPRYFIVTSTYDYDDIIKQVLNVNKENKIILLKDLL